MNGEIKITIQANLSKFIIFHSPLNHQKTTGFQIISREIQVNHIICIYLKFEAKFVDDPQPINDQCSASYRNQSIDLPDIDMMGNIDR